MISYRTLFIIFLAFIAQNSIAQIEITKVDSLENILTNNPKQLNRSRAYKDLAKIYLREYDLDNAVKNANKSLIISANLNADSLSQVSFKILGVASIYMGKVDSSLYYMQQSNAIAHKLHDSTVLSKNYGILSNIYNQFLNKPDQAFLYIDSAERYYTNEQIDERVFGKIVKGSIFVNVSSYHFALKEFYEGLDLVRKDDSTLITSLYNNIGTVFKSTGDYDAARENYRKSIQFSQNDPRSMGISYHNLALVYGLEAQLNKAVIEEQKAIEYLNKLGINSYLFQAQLSSSQWYFELGEKESAFNMFSSIDTSALIIQERLQWYTLGAIIKYPGFSFDQLDQQFRAKRDDCSNDILMDVSGHIYKHYKQKNNLEKALYYKEVYSNMNDSLFAYNQIVQVQRISLNRIVDEKNEELHQEQQDAIAAKSALLLEEEKSKQWKYILGLMSALAITTIVLIYQRYNSKKRRLSEQELTLAKERQQRQLLLNRLDEVKSQLADKNEQKVDSSEALMDQLNDRNWPNFLLEFELVYPTFFTRLEPFTTDPLSKNERRLCSLIKLGLSNKEIAEFVFVSHESVKKAKNRLFKKIHTTNSGSTISDIIRNL